MASYPWDYIDQMNGLLDSKLEGLTPSELYLYMKLFQINNNKHRVEWFELKNRMLSAFIDKDEKSMIRLRNSLQQKGLIEFKAGKKGQPSEYKLVLLYGKKNTGKNASENASICASICASENASICASICASEKVPEPQCLCGLPDPLKGKGKGKDNISPDLLANSTELTPAEEQVKSAFEQTFHPLTKLDELDALKAYTGDYGAKSVLRAIETASKSKTNPGDRIRLSPKYLLPILQREDEGNVAPSPSSVVTNPDMRWIPQYSSPEERAAERDSLRERVKAMRGY